MAGRERLSGLAITRRGLIAGAAAGGGLLLAWYVWPRSYSSALEPGAQEHGFGAWLTVDEGGVVTVAVPQLEMGQGVTTLLPQIVAMEMGAAWGQVAVAPVPPNGAQANIPLAAEAARMTPPDPPPLRPQAPMEDPLPGDVPASSAYPRLDLPAKVDGSFPFAGDIRLPGMVYVSIRHGAWGMRELVGFEEEAARGLGLVALVRSKFWLAAVADSWWKADRALDRLRPRFAGPGGVESDAVETTLGEALERTDVERLTVLGDTEAMQTPTLTRRYDIAPALHAPVETASATALYRDGRLQLWIASQAPAAARRVAAKAIGLSERDVAIYPVAAGGSFDARLESMHAIEAALIAREVGRPVQLTWPRGEEFKAVPPRTPAAIALSARLDPNTDRQPVAWRAKLAMPATMREFGARLFDDRTVEAAIEAAAGEADPLACEGAVPPYAIPNVVVDHAPVASERPKISPPSICWRARSRLGMRPISATADRRSTRTPPSPSRACATQAMKPRASPNAMRINANPCEVPSTPPSHSPSRAAARRTVAARASWPSSDRR